MADYRTAKVPDGHVDIVSYLRKGQLSLYHEHNKKEAEKLGSLRGGSCGAVIDGEVYGTCHRKAHLRMKGISIPLNEEIELMTRQGERNEDIWIEELRSSGLNIKTQSDLGLELELCGKTFTGSPDIAVLLENDIPSLGIENKNISSGSKAVTVNNQLEPDTTHLIQAATYSILLGKLLKLDGPLPYQLCYSSRSIWHVYSMAKEAKESLKKNPRDVQVSFGRQFALRPFHRIYYLRWVGGYMEYFTDGYKDWVKTPLTEETIIDYYDAVANGIEDKKWLGPRPTTKTFGKKKGYSQCGYCEFDPICNEHETNYDAWIDHASLLANTIREERELIN